MTEKKRLKEIWNPTFTSLKRERKILLHFEQYDLDYVWCIVEAVCVCVLFTHECRLYLTGLWCMDYVWIEAKD